MPPTTTTTAIAFDHYGSPDVLGETTIDLPEPESGQVRIAIRTIGFNPLDYKIRRGDVADFFPITPPHVLGLEAAGVVEAVGPDTTGLAVGDEVLGWTSTGSYAAHALAEVSRLVRRPATLGWVEAAALPVGAGTAFRCFELLRLREGETLLLHAAAGGVGVLATQLAVARGVRVIGTASEANHAYLRELGAIPVTYGDGLADRVRAAAPDGVDAALDGACRDGSLEASIVLTGGTERVVAIADAGAAAKHGVTFSDGQGLETFGQRAMAEALALHRAGTLRLPVQHIYPLDRVAETHRESERGHVRGKLVLVVG